jgi:hypothetical protein
VEQPIFCLFVALSAALNYLLFGGDAQGAFAHSPAPTVPTFVGIDNAYAEWYKATFGHDINCKHVLPVQHALKGHPEAARLWEEHISAILHNIGFRAITNKCNIYTATINNVKILLLRQVDNFALATPDPSIASCIYTEIGRRFQLPGEESPLFEQQGLISTFNGVDI